MDFAMKGALAAGALAGCALAAVPGFRLESPVGAAGAVQAPSLQRIDLAERFAAGQLRIGKNDVTKVADTPGAVHVAAKEGGGVVWLEGIELADGIIEMDVRGRDVFQQSFVGIAFHGKGDSTYDAVYLRPFNFRAEDPVRRQHAVQYMALPEYDWARLRKEFPEEFENPVDQSLVPTDWVPLRLVIKGKTIQVYVGPGKAPTLEIRKLGHQDRGMIGLWTGTNSDGAFRNLRITPAT
jgi:hypothetical protein